MKSDDINRTIKQIDDDLAENMMIPKDMMIPRAAPTQHGINMRPREINLESQMRWILECARLPGVDVMSGIDLLRRFVEPSVRHCFQIRCKQCSFRYRTRSKVYDLDQLGELHANRNNHEVDLTFHYGIFQTGMTILPTKPTTDWTYLLIRKWAFLSLPSLVAIIFASFKGWHTLPIYLFTSWLGGGVGELIYRKWLKPKKE